MVDAKYFKCAFVKGEKIRRMLKMRMSDSTPDATIDEIMEHKNFRVFKQNTRKVRVPTNGRHIR